MLLEIGNTKAKLKFSFKCKKKGLKGGRGQGNMSQQNKKIKTEILISLSTKKRERGLLGPDLTSEQWNKAKLINLYNHLLLNINFKHFKRTLLSKRKTNSMKGKDQDSF